MSTIFRKRQDTTQNRHFHFDETQRLNNWFIWTITLGILFFFISILLYQVLTGNQFGDKPAPNWLLVGFIIVICVPSILLVRHTKLVTRIDNNSIYYGWNIPTDELNEIKFVDIASCDVIKYSFVGYGYRISAKYGTVYNTSGNEGLQIITKSGDKILVGTHKSAELADALRKMNVRHNL